MLAILIIVVGGGYWYVTSQTGTPAPGAEDTQAAAGSANEDQGLGDVSQAPMEATVTYTAAAAFQPQTVTIKKGGTVTWVNRSGTDMWIGSAPHPDHDGYDGTTRSEHCAADYAGSKPFDQCSTGDTFSFTFDKVGSFNYHNHRDEENYGTIRVVE